MHAKRAPYVNHDKSKFVKPIIPNFSAIRNTCTNTLKLYPFCYPKYSQPITDYRRGGARASCHFYILQRSGHHRTDYLYCMPGETRETALLTTFIIIPLI